MTCACFVQNLLGVYITISRGSTREDFSNAMWHQTQILKGTRDQCKWYFHDGFSQGNIFFRFFRFHQSFSLRNLHQNFFSFFYIPCFWGCEDDHPLQARRQCCPHSQPWIEEVDRLHTPFLLFRFFTWFGLAQMARMAIKVATQDINFGISIKVPQNVDLKIP